MIDPTNGVRPQTNTRAVASRRRRAGRPRAASRRPRGGSSLPSRRALGGCRRSRARSGRCGPRRRLTSRPTPISAWACVALGQPVQQPPGRQATLLRRCSHIGASSNGPSPARPRSRRPTNRTQVNGGRDGTRCRTALSHHPPPTCRLPESNHRAAGSLAALPDGTRKLKTQALPFVCGRRGRRAEMADSERSAGQRAHA